MKKIAIMQPYFFPYIGYFSLIKNTDYFILLDTVQFIRHGWIERNRILKQKEGWLYVKVPLVKHSRETLIKDIMIDNSHDWRRTLASQLEIYKKKAPYYSQVNQLVTNALNQEFKDIVSLNKATLEAVCNYLGIKKEIRVFSKMNLQIESPKTPDDWALSICKAIGGVSEYWNLPGGQELFNKSKYEKEGISVRFQKPMLEEYNQKRQAFEPGLSIIDVIMFNPVDQIKQMLDNFELV